MVSTAEIDLSFTCMKDQSSTSILSILQLRRLQMHLKKTDPPTTTTEKTKGNFTGARIPKLPGGNSRPSAPWHSSCSMWKIHFSWLKALASSPLISQLTPQQPGRVSHKVRGRVSGSGGRECSRHDDYCSSPWRISFLSDGKSNPLLIICVCLGCFNARICCRYCFFIGLNILSKAATGSIWLACVHIHFDDVKDLFTFIMLVKCNS